MESSPKLENEPDVQGAAAARLREMIMGFRVTQLVYVAAKLNLADHLANEPQTAERLAASVGADPAALRRVMRALTSLGVLTETGASFALTAVGQLLRRNAARFAERPRGALR